MKRTTRAVHNTTILKKHCKTSRKLLDISYLLLKVFALRGLHIMDINQCACELYRLERARKGSKPVREENGAPLVTKGVNLFRVRGVPVADE